MANRAKSREHPRQQRRAFSLWVFGMKPPLVALDNDHRVPSFRASATVSHANTQEHEDGRARSDGTPRLRDGRRRPVLRPQHGRDHRERYRCFASNRGRSVQRIPDRLPLAGRVRLRVRLDTGMRRRPVDVRRDAGSMREVMRPHHVPVRDDGARLRRERRLTWQTALEAWRSLPSPPPWWALHRAPVTHMRMNPAGTPSPARKWRSTRT